MPEPEPVLVDALHRGDPQAVAALISGGADIRYRRDHGYDALIDAVHGRDLTRDARLLDLLRLLVVHGVDLGGVTTYKESGLRVLSHVGRFDAVRLLLDAGADKAQLRWTPLIEAVALGALEEVDRLARDGADLEATDWWSRTAFLVAVLAGDLGKAQLLRERGANVDARGRCNAPAFFFAIAGHHPEMVRWLIGMGQGVEQTDEFGKTPLIEAVDAADLECIDVLLAAGADVDRESRAGGPLERAGTKEIAWRLLEAGAHPGRLSHEGHRMLCGLGEVRAGLDGVSAEAFRRAPTRVFGLANPERMQEPFWEAMIRAGVSAFEAGRSFDPSSPHARSPVWCAHRFGQSITFLPDGRIVQIAGEHEDYYDDDFCIYNDVFVHGGDGTIAIFGYPEAVFPPTDFHTATLMDDAIYVIGSLGYVGARRYGETPVYRLDLATLRMERVDARGEAPGWIFHHRAVRAGPSGIRVTGGTVATLEGGKEAHKDNAHAFVLDVERRVWRRQPPVVT